MLTKPVRQLVRSRGGALADGMVAYLEALQALAGIEHQARFDKGQGPTGIYTTLDGAPFAWLFPGRKPCPVVQVHTVRPEEVASRHPGAFAGAKNTPRSRKNIVHVEIDDPVALVTAEAVALDIYHSVQRPVVVTSRGASMQRVARAGEYFVAAELNRRGAYAVTFAGNMPNIDILASDAEQKRTVMIQVKTRRKGSWHSSSTRGIPRTPDDADANFWVFVDLPDAPAEPSYFVAPEWWVLNDIYVKPQGLPGEARRQAGQEPGIDSSRHQACPDRTVA